MKRMIAGVLVLAAAVAFASASEARNKRLEEFKEQVSDVCRKGWIDSATHMAECALWHAIRVSEETHRINSFDRSICRRACSVADPDDMTRRETKCYYRCIDDRFDRDGDLNDNEEDNCPYVDNRHQDDNDGDGVGNACGGDRDSDGVTDYCELNPSDRQVVGCNPEAVSGSLKERCASFCQRADDDGAAEEGSDDADATQGAGSSRGAAASDGGVVSDDPPSVAEDASGDGDQTDDVEPALSAPALDGRLDGVAIKGGWNRIVQVAAVAGGTSDEEGTSDEGVTGLMVKEPSDADPILPEGVDSVDEQPADGVVGGGGCSLASATPANPVMLLMMGAALLPIAGMRRR